MRGCEEGRCRGAVGPWAEGRRGIELAGRDAVCAQAQSLEPATPATPSRSCARPQPRPHLVAHEAVAVVVQIGVQRLRHGLKPRVVLGAHAVPDLQGWGGAGLGERLPRAPLQVPRDGRAAGPARPALPTGPQGPSHLGRPEVQVVDRILWAAGEAGRAAAQQGARVSTSRTQQPQPRASPRVG